MNDRKQTRGKRFVWHDGDFVVLKRGEPIPRRRRRPPPRGPAFGLAEIRRRRQITQEQLAQLLGVDQAQVSRLESREDFRVSTVRDYLTALGLVGAEVTLTFNDGTELVIPLEAGASR